jgi:hypothetical protein
VQPFNMDNILPKQQSGTFLRRTRGTAGLLLLVFGCGASARLVRENTIPEGALGRPDGMMVLDSRYAKLRPFVPQGQVVCFLAESGVPRENAVGEYYSAEYGLAPSLLTLGSNCESFLELTSQGACVGTRFGESCETF